MWAARRRFFLLLLLLLAAAAAAGDGSTRVLAGADCPPGAATALRALLARYPQSARTALPAISLGREGGADPRCEAAAAAPAGTAAEAFAVTFVGSPPTVACVHGNPLAPDAPYAIGVGFGAFALLEEALGFGFLHPLAPTLPVAPLRLRLNATTATITGHGPRFPFRAFHIHTEHPLEMLDLLQGSDAVLGGNASSAAAAAEDDAEDGGSTIVPWADMHHEFVAWCSWALANKVNRVEWVLLQTPAWLASGFVNSTLRQARLRNLTATAQSHGLLVGADVPIAEIQQRAWYIVHEPTMENLAKAETEIATRLRWLFGDGGAGKDGSSNSSRGAGFDYLATESGFSEFTHPNGTLMLALMNLTADRAAEVHSAPTYIKCHCSTGQVSPGYPDPRPGRGDAPINFNFLPHYSSPNMGILPHSVQAYALDDPTAGTYGNQNFSDLFDFMMFEAAHSNRTVVFHPETNYWVNVDVDVPLFLPVYGQRRVRDLRLIAAAERRAGKGGGATVDGQNIFDSGWEWGSWLSDVVSARAAWDGAVVAAATDADAYGLAMQSVARALGADCAAACLDVVARTTRAQQRLLVEGRINATSPRPSPEDLAGGLSGFPYLSGMDSWTSLLAVIKPHAVTQPRRVHFRDHSNKHYPRVAPLLAAMNSTFGGLAAEYAALRPRVAAAARDLWDDLSDAMAMVALRARQVALLYAAAAPGVDAAEKKSLLAQALRVMGQAATVVERREAHFRVQPAERISGWRPENPSAYDYGYVWTAHSLYYFWRDYGIVQRGGVDAVLEPCYLNMIDTTDTALGVGLNVSRALRRALRKLGVLGDVVGTCLAPPPQAYEFPRDLYRYR